MENEMLRVDHVTKEYRLGMIGGTTLKEELQSRMARMRNQEDPNQKIGAKVGTRNEKFLALNDVSFSVKKGEAVGIIGHNGAGKSTLLKLITRITAPTSGEIGLNGRIASMLEVGTGFHPELTGRENIYMNGAILGMTKAEIDKKMEDIIDFSEVRQFIDTPVKRYSSGMYVKLAFSVAAHLDSEIMIMDEVLAVGDMAFQTKCLNKMRDAAKQEGRTVLYVSHNMNTIRKLCDRCIVMEKGKVIYEGEVDEAIRIYMGNKLVVNNDVDLTVLEREKIWKNSPVKMNRFQCFNSKDSLFEVGSSLTGSLELTSEKNINKLFLRMVIKTTDETPVTMTITKEGFAVKKEKRNILNFEIDLSHLAPGRYTLSPVIFQVDEFGNNINLEVLHHIYFFEITPSDGFNNNMRWESNYWGNLITPYINLLSCKTF